MAIDEASGNCVATHLLHARVLVHSDANLARDAQKHLAGASRVVRHDTATGVQPARRRSVMSLSLHPNAVDVTACCQNKADTTAVNS